MALRELALRRTAQEVDDQLQEYMLGHEIAQTWPLRAGHGVCRPAAARRPPNPPRLGASPTGCKPSCWRCSSPARLGAHVWKPIARRSPRTCVSPKTWAPPCCTFRATWQPS